jgi:hypothetical protein
MVKEVVLFTEPGERLYRVVTYRENYSHYNHMTEFYPAIAMEGRGEVVYSAYGRYIQISTFVPKIGYKCDYFEFDKDYTIKIKSILNEPTGRLLYDE